MINQSMAGGEQESGEMCVCVCALPDGTYQVGTHEQYMAQQGMQPAASIEEATQLLVAMLSQEQGELPEDERSEAEQVQAGYNKAPQRNMQAMAGVGKPGVKQVFGE